MAWATTGNPRTEFVTFRVTAAEAQALDAAVTAGVAKSRSDLLRVALRSQLKRTQKVLAAQAEQQAGASDD